MARVCMWLILITTRSEGCNSDLVCNDAKGDLCRSLSKKGLVAKIMGLLRRSSCKVRWNIVVSECGRCLALVGSLGSEIWGEEVEHMTRSASWCFSRCGQKEVIVGEGNGSLCLDRNNTMSTINQRKH